jgi:DDE superfamily endonuclease
LAKVREMVLPAIERQGPIEAWILDDTGFPKQGTHSVGVQHQYCGQLGKEAAFPQFDAHRPSFATYFPAPGILIAPRKWQGRMICVVKDGA